MPVNEIKLNSTVKKLLVPCDFSAAARNAFYTALTIPPTEEFAIHLLHVIELPVMHDAVLMPAFNYEDSLMDALRKGAENGFRKLISEVGDMPVPVYTHVCFGPVSLSILNFIRAEKIDQVVMGTKGASGFKEVFIGSIAERIVRNSPAPVLVVKKRTDVRKLKEIVFPAPTNFAEEEELLQRVKLLQGRVGGTLHLLWVNTPANFAPDHATRKRLAALASRYMLKNFTVNIYNDVYEETGIIHFAHEINADIIAMGTHGRTGIAHVFGGSITEDVVNHVDLPIWTLSLRGELEQTVTEE